MMAGDGAVDKEWVRWFAKQARLRKLGELDAAGWSWLLPPVDPWQLLSRPEPVRTWEALEQMGMCGEISIVSVEGTRAGHLIVTWRTGVELVWRFRLAFPSPELARRTIAYLALTTMGFPEPGAIVEEWLPTMESRWRQSA